MLAALNPLSITEFIEINKIILSVIENIVVLYFFLLLLKFFVASSPGTPNNFLVIFDTCNYLFDIFISLFSRIASIGEIFVAFLAGFIDDIKIIIADSITEIIIAIYDT